MLTKKTYKGLGIHFKLSELACTLPFIWNPETSRVSCTTDKKRQIIWFFNMITSLAPTFRLIQCFALGIWNEDRTIALLALDFLYIIPYGMQVFFHWANIFHKEEVAHLLNAITSIDKKFTEIYSIKPTENEIIIEENSEELIEGKKSKKKKGEETDGCDDNVFASTFMMFVYSGLSVSLFLKNPENPRYLYSVIRNFFNLRQGEQFLYYFWAAFEYFTLCKFCMTFNNVFYLLLLYAHSTNYWLKNLSCPENEDGEHETKKIKLPENFTEVLFIYKSEIVLNMHFNECCCQIFLPTFKVLNILLHTMAIYVSISFWDVIPIGGFLIFPIGFVMWCQIEADVYPLLGRVNGLSISYRDSWEYKMRQNFKSRRNFAQLYPLGVKVSNAYTINKTTVLSLWAIIFNLVINCIVM